LQKNLHCKYTEADIKLTVYVRQPWYSIDMPGKSSRSKKTASDSKRRPLTQARILKAALKLADRQGVESLSMRKLAQALNVEAMSLYNHVANKEEVLDGILDSVVSEFELPDTGDDWKKSMRARAVSAYGVLLLHPWAANLLISRVNVGPAMLTWTNATVGCLREAGFSYAMADHAWNAIDNHIYGFTLQRVSAPIGPAEYAAAAKHYLPLIPANQYPYLNAMASMIVDGTHSGVNDFEFGLDLILEGLDRILAGE